MLFCEHLCLAPPNWSKDKKGYTICMCACSFVHSPLWFMSMGVFGVIICFSCVAVFSTFTVTSLHALAHYFFNRTQKPRVPIKTSSWS